MAKKIYISADYEGATGVVSIRQIMMGKSPEFDRLRKLWQADVDAMVQGALDGGAERVLINEAHETMINLMPEHLPAPVEFISGRGKARFSHVRCGRRLRRRFSLYPQRSGHSPRGRIGA